MADLVGDTTIGKARKSLETEWGARAVAEQQLTASRVSGSNTHASVDAPFVSFADVFALAWTRQCALDFVYLAGTRLVGRRRRSDGRQLSASDRGAHTCIDAPRLSGFDAIRVEFVFVGRLEKAVPAEPSRVGWCLAPERRQP